MKQANQVLLLSELIGALSHALDITEGQPKGHSVRCCWIGMHIGEALALPKQVLADLYYTLLLKDLGCSSNAARICQLYLTDDLSFKSDFKLIDGSLSQALKFVMSHTGLQSGMIERLRAVANIMRNGGKISTELIEARCFRGADIAKQMRFSEAVCDGIRNLDEHWDGSGKPEGRKGDRIPLLSQIALLSQVADVFHTTGGQTGALDEIANRKGTWFGHAVANAFASLSAHASFWAGLSDPDLPARIVALEPESAFRVLDEKYIDDIALGFAKVIDAKSNFTAGHSERVAAYAVLTAQTLGESVETCRIIHRAGLLHDIGKLGISNSVLDKPDKLTPEEFNQVKSHPVYSGAILSSVSVFKDIATVGLQHHEKLDGSGYPHGLKGNQITHLSRIVTVADIYDALTADRPYRAAMPMSQAFAIMEKESGPKLDAKCFEALRTIMTQFSKAA
jgi:HD-GYP domain-containing protein (c-di-GMP phosphodiesterase class II)